MGISALKQSIKKNLKTKKLMTLTNSGEHEGKPTTPYTNDQALSLVKDQWRTLKYESPNPQTLSKTLNNVSLLIKKWPDKNQKREMRTHIKQNFDLWAENSKTVLKDFHAPEFIRSLSGMARIGIKPFCNFMDNALRVCKKDMHQISSERRGFLFWALSEEHIRPEPNFISAWEHAELKTHTENINPLQILTNLQADARLRIKHSPEYIDYTKKHLQTFLKKPNCEIYNQAFENNFLSCAILDSLGQDMTDIALLLHERLKYKFLQETRHQRQHYRAALWFNLDSPYDPGIGDDKQSFLELELQNAFNKAGFKTEHCEGILKKINHIPDIILPIQKKGKQKKLLIEVNGGSHLLCKFEDNYYHHDLAYDGLTLFNDALTKKFNPSTTTPHMRAETVKKILKNKEKIQKGLLKKLASKAYDLPPNSYDVMIKKKQFTFEELEYTLF